LLAELLTSATRLTNVAAVFAPISNEPGRTGVVLAVKTTPLIVTVSPSVKLLAGVKAQLAIREEETNICMSAN